MSEFKLIDIFKYSHFMHIHYIFYFNFKVGFIFKLCYTNYGVFTFFPGEILNHCRFIIIINFDIFWQVKTSG